MPGKSKQNQTMKTWDSYVKEASKPPFVIKVSDEQSITVSQPTGQQVLDAQEMFQSGSTRQQLETICGDAWTELEPLLMAAPGEVMGAIVGDIMAHFDFDMESAGEDAASPN